MSNELNINELGGGGQNGFLLRRRMMVQAKKQMIDINWNQLVSDTALPNRTYGGVTITREYNGVFDLYGTSTVTNWNQSGGIQDTVRGHKCYGKLLSNETPSKETFYLTFLQNGDSLGYGKIVTPRTNGRFYFYIIIYQGYSLNHTKVLPEFIDLTQMFGSGNEPSTVEEFESWLQENGINPNEYIPYDTGTPRVMTKPSWIQ